MPDPALSKVLGFLCVGGRELIFRVIGTVSTIGRWRLWTKPISRRFFSMARIPAEFLRLVVNVLHTDRAGDC